MVYPCAVLNPDDSGHGSVTHGDLEDRIVFELELDSANGVLLKLVGYCILVDCLIQIMSSHIVDID
jgi:hypothetical protein